MGVLASLCCSVIQSRRAVMVPPGQRRDPVFAPFAVASHVRAGARVHISAGESADFGDPKPGLNGDQQQRVAASAGPGGWSQAVRSISTATPDADAGVKNPSVRSGKISSTICHKHGKK